jgi:hypothetical protein
MPSPESDLEQLLSASLDGELTPEQQLELDQLFANDPELSRQRDELVALRGLVRQSLLSQRPQTLGRGFADRVIDAAIAKAEAEGVRSDHPLVRLAHGDAATDGRSNRNALDGPPPGRFNWRYAGALATLAASIAFVAFLSNRPRDREPSASREVASGKGQVRQGLLPQPSDANSPSADVPDTKTSPKPTTEIAASPTPSHSPVPNKGPVPVKPTPPATVADAMPAQVANIPPAGGVKLAAVMVVAFDLTEHGEDSMALDQALASEGISLGVRGELDDEMVDELVESKVIAAGDEPNVAEEPWNVYFVQAPATQISSFVDRLSRDEKSFDDFSWGIASDPDGSIDIVEQFAASPTKAAPNQRGLYHNLVDTDGDAAQFRRGLGLMAINDAKGLRGMLPQSISPSEMSHLLLLVK